MIRLIRPSRPTAARLPWLAAFSVLSAVALLAASGCGSARPPAVEQIEVTGFAGYAPVPSDALAIRRADFDGRNRLATVIQGYRYQLLRGRFRLAAGAFSDMELTGHSVPVRDAVRVGADHVFMVRVAVPVETVYNAEQRLVLTRGRRYELMLTLGPTGDTLQMADGSGSAIPVTGEDAAGPITLDRLRGALEEGLRQALRLHHREGALQASGRLFVLRFRPELEPDPTTALPVDPGDSPTRNPEYRYRLGRAMRPTTGASVRFRLTVVVIADRAF